MAENPEAMRCMEVWGGNQTADQGVAMIGLDAWVYSRPFEGADAGGDIHYMSSCATGRIARVLLADVSGHGAQAAELAGGLRNLMRRYVNFVDQERLVRGLNESFAGLADLGRFATAVVITFWTPTREISVSNAGHPRPLLRRAKTGTWSTIEPPATPVPAAPMNIPLGIAEPTRYDERRLRLANEDLVLCYTDAVIESRDDTGAQLGTDGLLDLVASIDPVEPDELIPGLVDALLERSGGGMPDDDLTLLLLRPNGARVRVSPMESLGTAARVAGAMLRDIPRGSIRVPQITLTNVLGAAFPSLNRKGLGTDDLE